MIELVMGVVVMVAELDVIPEQRDAFIELVVDDVDASRAFEGNLQFDILVDQQDPGSVMFVEKWKTPEAQEAYMAWRAGKGDFDLLKPYLTAPPKLTIYRQATD